MSAVVRQFDEVASGIARCASTCGRADGVKLLAVSKTFPASDIAELYAHGVRCFGESRLPEFEAKAAALPPDIEWHFIGRLQANKVRKIVRLAAVIHSVDSVSLIERIERIAEEEKRAIRFLLEVNCSGEEAKGGIASEMLGELVAAAKLCCTARCSGLMTMAREGASEFELKRSFAMLRDLRDHFRPVLGNGFRELSMGMSGDYPQAIACGATIVRIGTAIFGHRNYPEKTTENHQGNAR